MVGGRERLGREGGRERDRREKSEREKREQTCQPSRFWRDSPAFYQMSRVPLNHGNVPLFVRSRIFSLRALFVGPLTLPLCPERNYGNSVRFLAKIPTGRPTAAESPCYSVFWNAIDFCRLYRPYF